jgi:hypothetical protein
MGIADPEWRWRAALSRVTASSQHLACCYDVSMRTTVTLDPDIASRLRDLARERRASFKATLNATLRAGLDVQRVPAEAYQETVVDLGVLPGIDLTKALQLASQLEDEAIVHKLELRK